MSPGFLSEVETAQAIGKKTSTRPAINTPWIAPPDSRRRTCRPFRRGSARETGTGRCTTTTRCSLSGSLAFAGLALVVDPAIAATEDQHREHQDVEEQDPGEAEA